MLLGGGGVDDLDGGGSDDVLSGGGGADQAAGGPGADFVSGNGGADVLAGDGGDDTLIGGIGSDSADGGAGTDDCIAESTVQCEGSDAGVPADVAPEAFSTRVATDEDVAVDVIFEGADALGDAPLTFAVVDPPVRGTLGALRARGRESATATYTPDPNKTGLDRVRFSVTDPAGNSAEAVAKISVRRINDAPAAADDSGAGFGTDEDNSFTTGDVFANDTDVDGGPPRVAAVDRTGTLGLVTNNGDGTFGYDPNGKYESLGDGDSATDSFGYTYSDRRGGTDTATVTIAISGVNDAPSADADAITVDEDTASGDVTATLLVGDADAEGDTLTITAADDTGTTGAVTLSSVIYDPDGQFESLADGESATDSFDYTVSDGNGGTATATVTVTVDGVNDAPTAVDDGPSGELTTDEDTLLSVNGVLDNDTDPDTSDTLAVTKVADTEAIITGGGGTAVNGAVTLASGALLNMDADGTFTYDANGQFESLASGDSNTDNFAYEASDGNGGTDTATTTTIIIDGVNDPPVITSSSSASVVENQTGASDVGSSDPEGETEGGGGLTYSFSGGDDSGSFSIDANSGVLTFSTGRRISRTRRMPTPVTTTRCRSP